jgi:hypothetical protein
MSTKRTEAADAPLLPPIPPERARLIAEHVAGLSETARRVAATLPLMADAIDHARILEEAART